MTGCIVGWAHSKFGKHDGRDIESLIVEVAQAALADAGVAAADIDTVYLGTMNGGFVRQEFPASLVFQADPAISLQAGDAGRECLRHRLGGDPSRVSTRSPPEGRGWRWSSASRR